MYLIVENGKAQQVQKSEESLFAFRVENVMHTYALSALPYGQQDFDASWAREKIEEAVTNSHSRVYMILDEELQVAGVFWVGVSEFIHTKSLGSYDLGLFMLPMARGQGLARKLIEAAMSDLKSIGVKFLTTNTYDSNGTSAQSLYDKLGFEAIGHVFNKAL